MIFGGLISFDELDTDTDFTAAIRLSSTHAGTAPFYIRSHPNNPAQWQQINTIRSFFRVDEGSTHPINFESFSFQHTSVPSLSYRHAFLLSTDVGNINITVHESMTLQQTGGLMVSGGGLGILNVGGQLSISNSRVGLLSGSGPSLISARDIITHNLETVMHLIASSEINVRNDFIMEVTNTVLGSKAISVEALGPGLSLKIAVGNELRIQGFRNEGYSGSAIQMLFDSPSISITAKTISIIDNSVPYLPGVLVLSETSSLTLNAANIIFRNNTAVHGGAIFIEGPGARLQLIGDVTFDSNSAESKGGAAFVYPSQVSAFSNSNFFSNVAREGCTLFIVNSCQPFRPNGMYGHNIQLSNSSLAQCYIDAEICSLPGAPSATVVPSVIPQCEPSPPPRNPPMATPEALVPNEDIEPTIDVPSTPQEPPSPSPPPSPPPSPSPSPSIDSPTSSPSAEPTSPDVDPGIPESTATTLRAFVGAFLSLLVTVLVCN
jgi:hypothetical protein